MPIGAIIGGVASVAGSVLSSSAQKKAAKQAANVSQQNAQLNDRTIRDMYAQNSAVLAPWQQSGLQANQMYNALLGIPNQQPAQPMQQAPMQNALGGYSGGLDGYSGGFETMGGDYPFMGYGMQQPVQQVQPSITPQTAQNAFDTYRGSTGYNFRMNEGIRAIDAGAPVRNSGATLKARMNYGQNLASEEFGRYLGYLGNQQNLGYGAASAQAGVGQNVSNSLVANNNANATNQGNALLARGNANAAMWNGIGNGFGMLMGSSFG